MPEPAAFLNGFGFRKGTTMGGFTLVDANATHETVTRYREYLYHINLSFANNGNGNISNLITAIKSMISGDHIIKSGYGNPYKCVIEPPNVSSGQCEGANNKMHCTVRLIGHSYRV